MHLQLVLLGILVGSAWIVAACSGASRDASAQQVHPGSNASKAPNVTATEVNGNICAEVLSAWFSLSDIRINTPKDIRLGETKTVQLHFAQPISSGELVQRLAGRSESECLQSVQIALGNTMEARLLGTRLRIRPLTPQTQVLKTEVPNEWKWEIEATEAGVYRVDVVLYMFLSSGGETQLRAIQAFDKTFNVQAASRQRLAKFFAFVGTVPIVFSLLTIAGVVIIWLVRRKKKRRVIYEDRTTGVTGWRPPWWKRLWRRTGFGGKTLWEWLQLLSALAIPIILAGATLVFTAQQEARQQKIEGDRANLERELEEQRAQDVALQAYLDQMNHLLLERNIRDPEKGSEARTLARARTLSVLSRLDPGRKAEVMRFLIEANLISSVDEMDPVINLDDADLERVDLDRAALIGVQLSLADLDQSSLSVANLRNADLSAADLRDADLRGTFMDDADLSSADLSDARLAVSELRGANLSGANLSNVDLSSADLSHAKLRGALLNGAFLEDANLRCADLREATGVSENHLRSVATSLQGATMPDGSKEGSC